MTRQEMIYDIISILTKFGYTDDDTLDEDYIGFKIDQYRAKEIRDSYDRKPMLDPVWFQDYGITDFTEVNTADDKTLSFLNCKLYKTTLPPLVSFSSSLSNENNLGIQLFSADMSTEYYFQSFPDFAMRMKKISHSHPAHLFQYFTQVGRSIYVTKGKKLRLLLVMENPLDGFVIQSENLQNGELVVGSQYEVTNGQIVHNLVTYINGQIFVAINTLFTGMGTVQYVNQKKKMTWTDQYPISNSQVEVIILKILTQEFKIKESSVTDARNDSSNKNLVTQNEQ